MNDNDRIAVRAALGQLECLTHLTDRIRKDGPHSVDLDLYASEVGAALVAMEVLAAAGEEVPSVDVYLPKHGFVSLGRDPRVPADPNILNEARQLVDRWLPRARDLVEYAADYAKTTREHALAAFRDFGEELVDRGGFEVEAER